MVLMALVWLMSLLLLRQELGVMKNKPKFSHKSSAVGWLSFAASSCLVPVMSGLLWRSLCFSMSHFVGILAGRRLLGVLDHNLWISRRWRSNRER